MSCDQGWKEKGIAPPDADVNLFSTVIVQYFVISSMATHKKTKCGFQLKITQKGYQNWHATRGSIAAFEKLGV